MTHKVKYFDVNSQEVTENIRNGKKIQNEKLGRVWEEKAYFGEMSDLKKLTPQSLSIC